MSNMRKPSAPQASGYSNAGGSLTRRATRSFRPDSNSTSPDINQNSATPVSYTHLLAALLTWVQFSPVLNVMKAILITVIAISSLSTYLYCEYLVFGKKIGFALDVFTVASWQILIPLGVMGIWQLMSTIRIYVVMVAIVISIARCV